MVRPAQIHYSHRPWNDVHYKYGSSGNNTGCLIAQRDATGIKYFEYGNMGDTYKRGVGVDGHHKKISFGRRIKIGRPQKY